MINNEINRLLDRHSDSLKREDDNRFAKLLFSSLGVLSPHKLKLIRSVYGYMRILDDFADESLEIKPVKTFLLQEQSALLSKTPSTALQKRTLIFQQHTSTIQDRQIQRLMARIVSGMLIDLDIRLSQKPVSSLELKRRNLLSIAPVIQCFGVGFGSGLVRITPKLAEAVDAWGSYDNLKDLEEDLTKGLVLISGEDVIKHQLIFNNEHQLPIKELRNYYNDKRDLVVKKVSRTAGAFITSGLPIGLGLLAWGASLTRGQSLPRELRIKSSVVYRQPIDCLSSQ